MAEGHAKLNAPDLIQGIALSDLSDGGKFVGHCGEEQVLLAHRGAEIFATCTHWRAAC